MVYDYLITLKKKDHTSIDMVSHIMHFFALISFGYFFYQYPKSGMIYLYLGIGIIASWVFNIIKQRKKGEALFRLGLLIAAVGWFLGPEKNIWMAILYALAGLLEKQVKFPQEIGFTEEEITFNTLPKRVLQWQEVQNVMIKDGLITIDQKNNKIYQKDIEGYVTAGIEKEFNEFCSRQIAAAASSEVKV